MHLAKSSLANSSNSSLVMRWRKSLPSANYETRISVLVSLESSHLAFSQAYRSLYIANLFSGVYTLRSMSKLFLNSVTHLSMRTLSKSRPPRNGFPLVASTEMSPEETSRIEISRVPPPRSNTTIERSSSSMSSWSPYAMEAAVGSLMIRMQLRPAISHASSVAFLCDLLK